MNWKLPNILIDNISVIFVASHMFSALRTELKENIVVK